MESAGKKVSSDTTSEENDRLEQAKEDTAAIRRSYGCSFCKRGFTNAQALGGHMNIHRKDRAKAKQITGSSFLSKPMNTDEGYMNPRCVAQISGEPAKFNPVQEAQKNYIMYYQPSVSSRRHPHAYHDSELLLPRSQSLSTNEDQLLGLRLGIGHKCVEDNEGKREIMKEDELDLELRLGHNL